MRLVAAATLAAMPAAADDIRVATFHTELGARGPGLLLKEIVEGSPRVDAVLSMIADAAPDILVLQDIDYDASGAALGALAERAEYPYRFALRPNSGMATGLDLDQDGRTGDPRDAQGYGRFAGSGGMAILSRHPIAEDAVRDLSDILWVDLPEADPPALPSDVAAVQRLSSVAHWMVPVEIDGTPLTLLTWHATAPVFDGPEDRNGRRNRDETALWLALLDGDLAIPPPSPPFVIAGVANIDPLDGEGRRDALDRLLADPRVTDPRPTSPGGAASDDPGHEGDPALDTVDYDATPGNLRLSYLLPSAGLAVTGSGVLWPGPDTPDARAFGPVEHWPRHRLVWVDVTLP